MSSTGPSRRRALHYWSTKANLLRQALKPTRNNAQNTARRCANNYWLKMCKSIQLLFETGDICRMYKGIKKVIGPNKCKTAPLKSWTGEIIKNTKRLLRSWVGWNTTGDCIPGNCIPKAVSWTARY